MQGVKGLLEQAGYQVFNPTLPFHTPYDHWSFSDGEMTVQKYVDVYIQVRAIQERMPPFFLWPVPVDQQLMHFLECEYSEALHVQLVCGSCSFFEMALAVMYGGGRAATF